MDKKKCLLFFSQIIVLLNIFLSFQTQIYGQRKGCKEIQKEKQFGRNVWQDGAASSENVDSDAADKVFVPTQNDVEKPKIYPSGFKPLQILSKPRAGNTEKSRANCIEGKVYLRLTFYSDGRVGNIKVIKGLPFGLTKQAIEAAKKLKFEPEIKNYKPVSVRKQIEYGFWLY